MTTTIETRKKWQIKMSSLNQRKASWLLPDLKEELLSSKDIIIKKLNDDNERIHCKCNNF